jgi:hypothetical protein
MRKTLLAVAACAALTHSAEAVIIVTAINRGTPVGTGGSLVATGYTGWTIRLTSDTGANITAVDMESGTNGLFGPFVQRWTSSGDDGSYDTSTINLNTNNENLTNSVLNFDSHLLQPGNPKSDANYVGKIGFAEDLGGATFGASGTQLAPFPANTDAAGFVVSSPTGSIQAAFGINGPQQSPVLDVACVVLPNHVVPSNFSPLGTCLVATAGGAPQLVFFVPEPAAAVPLMFGAALLLRRFRV